MKIFTKRNAIVGWFALKLWKRKVVKAAVPVPSARTGGAAAAAGTAAAVGGVLLIRRRKRPGEEAGEE